MSKKKFTGNISGKGYYIALVLCAVAIGITGYLYYRNTDDQPQQLSDTPANTAPQLSDNGQDDNMEVVATQGKDDPAPGEKPKEDKTPQPTKPTKPTKTVKPVSGDTVAPYSMEALCYNQTTRDWRVHDGMDIAAEAGTPVCASADGTVYTVCEDETMGMTVVIHHGGGYITEYASLAENVSVKAGDTVSAGQTIGYVGDSALLESAIGDHVHFSVTCDGKLVDPTDFLNIQ